MCPVLTPETTNPQIRAYFDALEVPTRNYLLKLRALTHEVASGDPRIGPVSETLKWGEPSYAPVKPGVGTAVRFGRFGSHRVAMFVNCQTTLVSGWREMFPHLTFSKTRALELDPQTSLPEAELEQCIGQALTYKLRQRS